MYCSQVSQTLNLHNNPLGVADKGPLTSNLHKILLRVADDSIAFQPSQPRTTTGNQVAKSEKVVNGDKAQRQEETRHAEEEAKYKENKAELAREKTQR